MKIVFVSDAIYPYNKGGKEKRLYEISTRLRKLGHDVHIYTMHWWITAETERVEGGVTLHAISKLYPLYKGDTRSVKEGVLFGIACLKLWKVKWDVLDVDHMPFFPVFSAWIVCLLTGRRKTFFGTWHEALSRKDWTDYMGVSGNIAALIERISIKLPYAISAASAHTTRLINSELHRTKRVTTIGSGVDTELINSLTPSKVHCDVLYSGRLVKDKNIDVLIDAIALARKTKPDISCIIIGHGIEKQNLVKQFKEAKLEKNITMLDPLPEAFDVYRYMKSAKVLCLPSVREGFGIVALEALACGTPVITTDAPANAAKDLIMRPEMGTVLSLSADNLANSILELTQKAKTRSTFEQLHAYDWQSVANTQTIIYGHAS